MRVACGASRWLPEAQVAAGGAPSIVGSGSHFLYQRSGGTRESAIVPAAETAAQPATR